MMSKISIEKKAQSLFEEDKVKKELETGRRIHFSVEGETEQHSVIYDREKDEWTCDCKFFSLKQRECSHIKASRLHLQKSRI